MPSKVFARPKSYTNAENAIGSLVFGVTEFSAQFLRDSQFNLEWLRHLGEELLPYLAIFGYVYGIFNLFKGVVPIIYDINEGKIFKRPATHYLEEILSIVSGLQLIYFSDHALRAGPAGLDFLYDSFLISAGIDLTIAIIKLANKEKATTEDLHNVLARTIAFVGWAAISYGHPIGWACVAASSLYYLYKNRSTYSFGLFKTPEANDYDIRNEPLRAIQVRI